MIRFLFFRRCAILFVIASVFATSGFSCTLLPDKNATELTKPVQLAYWRVFDGDDAFSDIISAYQKAHPNVTINYRKFRYEEYEKELLEAFAEDRGPDLFSIHNTWVDRYLSKLVSIPPKMDIGFLVTKGVVKKVAVPQVREVRGFTPQQVREQFVDVVSDDVIRPLNGGEAVYGLPFAVDTLALFYNRDLFNNAGLIDPPTTWQQFEEVVNRLTRRDASDELVQSAAAFGGSENVQRSFDIVSALMLQNGAQMAQHGIVTFDRIPGELVSRNIHPAIDALRFYTDFSSPIKQAYTWNEDMPSSIEAFIQGSTAMFFGYSYHASLLRLQAPRLRFSIVPLPQIDPNHPATYANYWIEVIPKKSRNPAYAWDFLQFASSAQAVNSYLTKTGKPTALRELIASQRETASPVRPFASQLLFARSWYRGRNAASAERAFIDMIHEAIASRGGTQEHESQKLSDVVRRARERVQAEY